MTEAPLQSEESTPLAKDAPAAQSPPPSLPVAAATPEAKTGGCLAGLGWLGAGLVLPAISLNFYALAARRRTGSAIVFFVVFMLIVTGLQTLRLGLTMIQAGIEIRRAFEAGRFPEITITNGVAEVRGQQPFVFEDQSASIPDYFRAERPLRAWRALIALPLLLDIALEMIFGWNLALVTWPLALLTFGALLTVSAWPLIRSGQSSAPG